MIPRWSLAVSTEPCTSGTPLAVSRVGVSRVGVSRVGVSRVCVPRGGVTIKIIYVMQGLNIQIRKYQRNV